MHVDELVALGAQSGEADVDDSIKINKIDDYYIALIPTAETTASYKAKGAYIRLEPFVHIL